jgi:hypothetical protein
MILEVQYVRGMVTVWQTVLQCGHPLLVAKLVATSVAPGE